MVNFSWRNDDDAVWHADDWSGGSDDRAWGDWSWSETWRASLPLVLNSPGMRFLSSPVVPV
eukprot:2590673-Lingulodinium_polyedra.AAC.1